MFCTQTPSFHGADTAHRMFFLSRPRSGRVSACSKGPRAHSADSRPWEAMWQRILERKICLNHFQVLMQSQSESKQYSILHKYTKIIRTGCEAYDRTSFDSVSWWAFYIYSLGQRWSLPSSLFWPADQWIVPSFEKHHRQSVTHTLAANWNFQSQTTLLEVHHQACLFGAGRIPGHNDEQEWIVISNSNYSKSLEKAWRMNGPAFLAWICTHLCRLQ